MDDAWIWCPDIVSQSGTYYYRFCSGGVEICLTVKKWAKLGMSTVLLEGVTLLLGLKWKLKI